MAATRRTACLLIHGFAGSPFEMEPLVPGLEALGCTVDLPALPGHAASIAEFRRTFFPDWLGFAEDRFLALAQNHDLVIPIGFSMGGSIALTLAARYRDMPQLGCVAGIAPAHTLYRLFPLNLRTAWLPLLPALQYLTPEIPLPGPSNPESDAIAPFRGYESPLCLPQLRSLAKGLKAMRGMLADVACPLFLLYDVNDRICRPESALEIARAVSSQDTRVRWLRMNERTTSRHMLTTHRDARDLVAKEIAAFAAEIMQKHAAR